VARERKLRQSVKGKDTNLECLAAGGGLRAVTQASAVGDGDDARRPLLADVVNAEQPGHLDWRTDLLQALALGRPRRVFVVVHETAG
jgi:hypothetical protein